MLCPSGGFDDYKPISRVIKYLKSKGFNVKIGRSLRYSNNSKNPYKYLSGNDENRLSDLIDFWSNPSVDAIFCLRGGYGILRLLKNINFNIFNRQKKILLGFSDATILLLAIHAKTGLVTFHGPMLGINFLGKDQKLVSSASEAALWDMLTNQRYNFSYSAKSFGVCIYPGRAHGKLLGGNLTSICSMLGSNYLPDFKDAILFLEDVNEEPYKIDRLITQLDNAGIFKKVKGLIFSSFQKCKFTSKKQVEFLLSEKIKKYKIPTIYGFPIGHIKTNYIVPIGIYVKFDARKCELSNS